MGARPSARPSAAEFDVSDVDPVLLRVGKAWSQLRRGGSMLELRQLMYGTAAGGRGPLLDVAQGDALDVILELGPVRMGDLAAALRVDASTATRTVARLVDAGLVERHEGTDRRVVKIVASEKGRRLQADMVRTATDVLGEILGAFEPAEAETLATLMERLVASLDAVVGAARAGESDSGALSPSS